MQHSIDPEKSALHFQSFPFSTQTFCIALSTLVSSCILEGNSFLGSQGEPCTGRPPLMCVDQLRAPTGQEGCAAVTELHITPFYTREIVTTPSRVLLERRLRCSCVSYTAGYASSRTAANKAQHKITDLFKTPSAEGGALFL